MAYSRIKIWIPGETLTASDLNDEFTGCIANENDLATDLASEVTNRNAAIAAHLPAGCMMPYAGSTAPANWLLCYGQAVSRTTYSTLFGVIGTTFGVGDGSSTFTLPDMRGRGFIGLDNLGGSAASRVAAATSLGDTGGAETHTHTGPSHTHTTGDVTLTAAQSGCPAHNHPGNVSNTAGSLNGVNAGISGINGAYVTGNNSAANASQAHNHGITGAGGTGNTSTVSNLTPYMAGGWIIKC